MPLSIAENIDCMLAMAKFPDKFFDLAIVDPPYGINAANRTSYGSERGFNKSGTKTYSIDRYKKGNWDSSPPDQNYFDELFRVSKNQIIWGANYFIDKIKKPSPSWVVWDKVKSGNYADCELAWTSFENSAKIFKYMWNGMLQQEPSKREKRIHITQKPIRLYDWLLKNYANKGDKILDTHLGSGSSRISAKNLGFDFWGYEIDANNFKNQEDRFNKGIDNTLFEDMSGNSPVNLF